MGLSLLVPSPTPELAPGTVEGMWRRSCSLPHASTWLHHSAGEHPVLGAGLSSTDAAGTLMGLARLGGTLREFSGVERMEGTKEGPSWGGRLSSSFPGLSVRPVHCLRQGWGGWARGRGWLMTSADWSYVCPMQPLLSLPVTPLL